MSKGKDTRWDPNRPNGGVQQGIVLRRRQRHAALKEQGHKDHSAIRSKGTYFGA